MNKELYINELGRLLDEIRRFTKLNGNWTREAMAGKDMAALKEIAISTRKMIDAIASAADEPVETKLLSSVEQFISAIEESNPDKLTESCHKLEAVKTEYEQEKIKAGKIQEVFQTDLREMEIHEAKKNALQDLVDLDLRLYSEVSAITLEVLEVQHYQLSNDNKVMEQKEEPEPEKKQPEKETKEQSTEEPEKQKEQSCKAYVYMKNTPDKKHNPKVIYGNSPEDIITTLQGWNMGRTDAMKFQTCYISGLDVKTNEYVRPVKYDVATGLDITPIYLNIPHMDRNGFLKTVDQLKKDGAKYNPVEKKFYVTRQNDLNKFSKYLPIMTVQPEVSTNQIQDNYSYEEESRQEDPKPETNRSQEETAEAKTIEYNGQHYNPLQYNVLELALKQNFTENQTALLERPDLSSDRLNEIRFAIKDGLSAEQIAMFATPEHEQWQMDLCRIGMQHGLKYADLQNVINPDNYSREQWGERRNQLAQLIKAKERVNSPLTPNLTQTGIQKPNIGKDSVLSKISQNKAKLEAGQNDAAGQTRERKEALERF